MNIRTCFDILGITGNASLEEAKQSYKRLVKRWHPDQYVNDPEKHRTANEKLTEINVAYREAVGLLKRATPGQSAGAQKDKTVRRDATNARTPTNKPTIFQRMASVLRPRKRMAGNVPGKAAGNPMRSPGHGFNDKGSSASEFQRILKGAVRNQPRRPPGTKPVEGRRIRAGRATGRSRAPFVPPRRSRGDRVEKVRPVRRVGKI